VTMNAMIDAFDLGNVFFAPCSYRDHVSSLAIIRTEIPVSVTLDFVIAVPFH